MTYTPCAMTEWDEPLIMDCVWASGLMLANKATLGAKPCTRAEREALARAAGLAEGHEAAAITDLERGMKARYGWTGTIYTGPWSGFVSRLGQGWGAVLLGYYHALPPHFTRWDPGFASKGIDSYHAMYFQRQPADTLWVIDPLFHNEPGYQGELIAASYAQAYATAYGSPVVAMLIAEGSRVPTSGAVLIPEEVEMLESGNQQPKVVALSEGTQLYDLAGNALIRVSVAQSQLSPFGAVIGDVRYRVLPEVTTGGKQYIVLVRSGDVTLTDPPAADCDDAIAEAAALAEELTTARAELASCRTDLTNATTAGFKDALGQFDTFRATVKPTS